MAGNNDKKIFVPNQIPKDCFCPFLGTQVIMQQDVAGRPISQGITPIQCLEDACKMWDKEKTRCKVVLLLDKMLSTKAPDKQIQE